MILTGRQKGRCCTQAAYEIMTKRWGLSNSKLCNSFSLKAAPFTSGVLWNHAI